MVRQWREVGESHMTAESLSWNGVVLLILGVLLSVGVICAVVFSCADGASKDKASATQNDAYGGTACAAGCGAGCGA